MIAAVAVFTAVGLVASEGIRFDGLVAMSPEQPLHLRDARGAEKVVPLRELSLDDAAVATHAVVMDDEGYGLRLLDRAPLDRRGLAFKVELGTSAFRFQHTDLVGLASHIQLGGFPTPRLGLLIDVGLSGGSTPFDETIARHSLGLEAQFFPARLGPLHFGVGAMGGIAVAADDLTSREGPVVGGGLLAEIELTTRLALTLRAGWNAARFEGVWSSAFTATAGVAVY